MSDQNRNQIGREMYERMMTARSLAGSDDKNSSTTSAAIQPNDVRQMMRPHHINNCYEYKKDRSQDTLPLSNYSMGGNSVAQVMNNQRSPLCSDSSDNIFSSPLSQRNNTDKLSELQYLNHIKKLNQLQQIRCRQTQDALPLNQSQPKGNADNYVLSFLDSSTVSATNASQEFSDRFKSYYDQYLRAFAHEEAMKALAVIRRQSPQETWPLWQNNLSILNGQSIFAAPKSVEPPATEPIRIPVKFSEDGALEDLMLAASRNSMEPFPDTDGIYSARHSFPQGRNASDVSNPHFSTNVFSSVNHMQGRVRNNTFAPSTPTARNTSHFVSSTPCVTNTLRTPLDAFYSARQLLVTSNNDSNNPPNNSGTSITKGRHIFKQAEITAPTETLKVDLIDHAFSRGQRIKSREVDETSIESTSSQSEKRPKRFMSAYNYFSRYERLLILQERTEADHIGNRTEKTEKDPAQLKSGESDNDSSSVTVDIIDPPDLPERYKGLVLNKIKRRRTHRKTHGKIGFIELSRTIAQRWKEVNPDIKSFFKKLAKKDLKRYEQELFRFKKQKRKRELLQNASRPK